MRLTKRTLIFGLVLVLMLSMIAGCTKAGDPKEVTPEPAETQDEGKTPETKEAEDKKESKGGDDRTLTIAAGADAVSLDAHGQNDQSSSRVRVQIYDNLLWQDKNLEFQPALAESWEQIDELTWKFTLKEGVKFHNGEVLTPEDVKYSMLRAMDSSSSGHIVGMLDREGFEIEGNTIIIKTAKPFGPFLAHMAHPAAAIVNKKAVEAAGENYGSTEAPVGTGPYKFVEWKNDDRIILERFDDYHGEPAKIKNLVFRVVKENANRTIELESGQVDIAYDIAPNDVKRVKENKDLVLIEEPNFSTTYIGFNCAKAPFDNPKVRQAINHAINMPELIDAVYFGVGAQAKGPLGPNVSFSNQELEPYNYDPEKAKAMLAEAGVENLKLTIWANENQQRMDIAEIVQNQLREIGIEADTEILEWGSYLERTAAGDHDMFILGWVSVTGDADYGLYALFHSSQFGDAGNRTFYKNEKVDELLDKGRNSTDEKVRAEAYKEVQQIIRDEAPWIFTWIGDNIAGTQKNVKGFELHPAGHYRLKNVEFTD